MLNVDHSLCQAYHPLMFSQWEIAGRTRSLNIKSADAANRSSPLLPFASGHLLPGSLRKHLRICHPKMKVVFRPSFSRSMLNFPGVFILGCQLVILAWVVQFCWCPFWDGENVTRNQGLLVTSNRGGSKCHGWVITWHLKFTTATEPLYQWNKMRCSTC